MATATEQTTLIFVYGSLMRGLGNHAVIDRPGTRFFGHYTTEERFEMFSVSGYYPGIKRPGKGRKGYKIHGELFDVSQETLHHLDILEGYDPNNLNGSHYQRIEAAVRPWLNRGRVYTGAQLYLYNGFSQNRLNHGNWRQYLGK